VRVKWLKRALQNLEDEAEYVASQDPRAATRLVIQIVSGVNVLAAHPALGRPGRLAGTREIVIVDTPYIAAYRVAAESVQILRVLHGARKWPVRL
jgi:toxin ParE1/3/4